VRVVRAYLDEENICSCFCEGDSHWLTNSSRATCYEGSLALEREELLYRCHTGCLAWCGSESFREELKLLSEFQGCILTLKWQEVWVKPFKNLMHVNQEVWKLAAEVDGFSCSTMFG
jgi:hypothetical protein